MIKIEIEVVEEAAGKLALYTATYTAVDSNMPTDGEVGLSHAIRQGLPRLFSEIRDEAQKSYLASVETKGEA